MFFKKSAKQCDAEGILLGKAGQFEKALACFEKAIKIDPNYAPAWHNKGASLNNLGRYEEAIECFDQAISLRPDYASAWLNRGNALAVSGNLDEAIACFEEAQSLGHPEAAHHAVQVRKVMKEMEAAASQMDTFKCPDCGRESPWFGGRAPSFVDAALARCVYCDKMWMVNLRTGENQKLS